MGNNTPAPQDQDLQPSTGLKVYATPYADSRIWITHQNNPNLLQNPQTGQQIEIYSTKNINDQNGLLNETLNYYHYRQTTAGSRLVTVLDYIVDSNTGCSCNNSSTSSAKCVVYTDRVFPLKHLQLSPQEGMFFLKEAVAGIMELQQLTQNYNCFELNNRMMGVNSQGKVKVWFNQNFAEPLPSDLVQHISQQETVDYLIDLISQQIESPHFLSCMEPHRHSLNFASAIAVVNNIETSQLLKVNKIFLSQEEYDAEKYRHINAVYQSPPPETIVYEQQQVYVPQQVIVANPVIQVPVVQPAVLVSPAPVIVQQPPINLPPNPAPVYRRISRIGYISPKMTVNQVSRMTFVPPINQQFVLPLLPQYQGEVGIQKASTTTANTFSREPRQMPPIASPPSYTNLHAPAPPLPKRNQKAEVPQQRRALSPAPLPRQQMGVSGRLRENQIQKVESVVYLGQQKNSNSYLGLDSANAQFAESQILNGFRQV